MVNSKPHNSTRQSHLWLMVGTVRWNLLSRVVQKL